MTRRALITGITGQDGSYLSELLQEKGYEVHGLVRRTSGLTRSRLPHGPGAPTLHYGDLLDPSGLTRLITTVEPHEIYHLAAQSHVKVSFDMPTYTAQTTGLGTLALFDAIRASGQSPRVYQAGSSEMFGNAEEVPQRETTPFHPRSPYGAAKVFAHWTAVNHREAYNLFACNGILFNHESPRRGENFVTRKITRAVAAIKLGLQKTLVLGNLDAKRDWGFAKDYVEGMWRMLQHHEPDDYILATGETHTVQEFCERAFSRVDLNWEKYVVIDPAYYRPTEVNLLLGDASKAKKKIGWSPKTTFAELVDLMVDADLADLRATQSKS